MTNEMGKQIPFPEWATRRTAAWHYTGWIQRNPPRMTFEELCKRAVVSYHGRVREIDLYPEGATMWIEEEQCAPD